MQRNLFTYIWRHSRPEQIVILGLVVLAQVFYFLSLTVPKSVINNGIQGNAFKDSKTIPFLVWELDLSAILPGKVIRIFDGFQVDQLGYLVTMSFVFLGAVVVNGLFKKTINTQKGRMGERMLRRLRYELYDRILRFPPAHFRKVKQAELATMIKDEVEPLGGFIGDAFVQPMFLGGQALTAILFIMLQNWLLGHHRRRPAGRADGDRPAAAPAGADTRPPAPDHGTPARRPHRRDRRRRARDPYPWRRQLRARRHLRAPGPHLQDPLRPLPEEVRRQVLEQHPVAGDAIRHLPGGRLLRHHRPDGCRRRGRRAAGLQGPAVADQGAARLGSAAPGRADQVRAGDRPVPARGHDARATAGNPRRPAAAARPRAGAGLRHRLRGRPRQAARQRVDGAADLQQARGDRRLELGQGRPGPGAGAAHLAERRLDQARRQRFLPVARIRAGRTHLVCRAGDLSLPAVGARQPAVRPENPADRAGQVRRQGHGGTRAVPQGGRALRQSVARSQRRLGRLRARRRDRPGRSAAVHGRNAEAGRARRGHLCARPARHDRSGHPARSRGEDPEGAPRHARPPAGSELRRPGRDLQWRPLQPQPVGRREHPVRHAARQGLRRRQHRGRPLHAVGAPGDRHRPRPAAHGPHHRRDHGRAVLRPVARQSVVRAVQLHLGRRTAQRAPAAAAPGRQGHRRRPRGRPAAPDDLALPLHRGAPSPRA